MKNNSRIQFSLMKKNSNFPFLNPQGAVVDPGSTNFGVSVAGWMLHSAVHAARPDIRCIIHIHHPCVVAVSVIKRGLMPLCQVSIRVSIVF